MSVTKNYKKMLEAADVDGIVQYFTQTFVNKYYDLYCQQLRFGGFDYRKNYRLKALLWKNGTAWIRKNPVGEPVVCDYTISSYNYDNLPATVQLLNMRDAPASEIPMTTQTVDKDGVIVWLRPNHKGLEEDVNYYIGKMAEAETCITINLAIQRMPWIIATEPENAAKLKDLMKKILGNEISIFTDIPRNEIDAITLPAPWIIDKLTDYEERQKSEIKTLLGVDNIGWQNREQQNLDTTNAANDEINDHADSQKTELEDGFDRANEVLGLHLTVKQTSKPVTQIGKKPEGGPKDDLLDLQRTEQ